MTGDLRRDLFRYLTGQSPTYFADRLPGTLASRITATSNAVFTTENMFAWNVLPPCIAMLGAIVCLSTVSPPMAGGLVLVGRAHGAGAVPPRRARRGRGTDDFAEKAASVDGEMVDVHQQHGAGARLRRIAASTALRPDRQARDGRAPASLLYLEKLRLFHAVVTVILTLGLLGWAILLWERARHPGDVVLVARSASRSCRRPAIWRWRWST